MAHFAKLELNSRVLEVHVVSNEVLKDENGIEQEALGIEFLAKLFDYPFWKQTSYNGSFRKNYAGIGYTYDYDRDAFISPKLYNSWILNESTCLWEAPTPYPSGGESYTWDEDSLKWITGDN